MKQDNKLCSMRISTGVIAVPMSVLPDIIKLLDKCYGSLEIYRGHPEPTLHYVRPIEFYITTDPDYKLDAINLSDRQMDAFKSVVKDVKGEPMLADAWAKLQGEN